MESHHLERELYGLGENNKICTIEKSGSEKKA